jgi:uncharacterized protein with HEPN domain
MPRDQRSYAADILEAITQIQIHTADWDEDDLTEQWNRWAVMKALEIIGEAAGQLSPETRAQMPDIPWGSIVGMRNMLVHVYFRANVKDIWDTIKNDLDPLKSAVEAFLNTASSQEENPDDA